MAGQYFIGGERIYRRSLIKLDWDERFHLKAMGSVLLRRPVEWPLKDRIPNFSDAYEDLDATDFWGWGAYLKVPNTAPDGNVLINRIFCPWGCPPDRLRIARQKHYLRLTNVGLERLGPADWFWLLSVEPWSETVITQEVVPD